MSFVTDILGSGKQNVFPRAQRAHYAPPRTPRSVPTQRQSRAPLPASLLALGMVLDDSERLAKVAELQAKKAAQQREKEAVKRRIAEDAVRVH